jgi:hypothetical protein
MTTVHVWHSKRSNMLKLNIKRVNNKNYSSRKTMQTYFKFSLRLIAGVLLLTSVSACAGSGEPSGPLYYQSSYNSYQPSMDYGYDFYMLPHYSY